MAEKRKCEQDSQLEPSPKRAAPTHQEQQKTIHFYDATEETYGALSNFYPCTLTYGGEKFATAEHLYHYKKYNAAESTATRQYANAIRTANTPYQAKLLANQTICHQYAWMEKLNRKIQAARTKGIKRRSDFDPLLEMEAVLWLKFSTCADAKKVLLSTAPHRLAEHTHRDRYWADGGDGTGDNHLGKLLVGVRDRLLAQDSTL